MTFVGKVFVVLQLVLTVCFMAFAGAVYTAETNWKNEAKSLADQKQQIETQLNSSRQDFEKLTADTTAQITDATTQIGLLDDQLKQAKDQLSRIQKENEILKTERDQQLAVANISEEQSTFRMEETQRQRERNARLQSQIDEQLAQIRSLQDTIFEKDTSIANMRQRHQSVLNDLATYRKILLANKMSLNPKDYANLGEVTDPPPNVVGQVLDARVSQSTGTEFIAVSLGSDDGFHKGHELTVYRGDEYLGRIKLVSVEADRAVGHLIPQTRPRNGAIQKGDNVRP